MTSHITSEPAVTRRRSFGLLSDAKPSTKVSANERARGWNRSGSRRQNFSRNRSVAARRNTEKRTAATSARRSAAGIRKKKTTEAPSKTRSKRTEASNGENGSLRDRARRAGRRISPTFPGRLFAAKPNEVATNAG